MDTEREIITEYGDKVCHVQTICIDASKIAQVDGFEYSHMVDLFLTIFLRFTAWDDYFNFIEQHVLPDDNVSEEDERICENVARSYEEFLPYAIQTFLFVKNHPNMTISDFEAQCLGEYVFCRIYYTESEGDIGTHNEYLYGTNTYKGQYVPMDY